MLSLKFKKLHPAARLPSKAHPSDAGWDLYATDGVIIQAGCMAVMPLGIAWDCPPGWYAQIRGRSGLARLGIDVLGGVVDPSFRGEWKIVLANVSPFRWLTINPGDRVGQFTIHAVPTAEVVEAGELAPSERGGGGFGSTGR